MKAQMNQDRNIYIVSAEDGTYETFALSDRQRAEDLLRRKEAERVRTPRSSTES